MAIVLSGCYLLRTAMTSGWICTVSIRFFPHQFLRLGSAATGHIFGIKLWHNGKTRILESEKLDSDASSSPYQFCDFKYFLVGRTRIIILMEIMYKEPHTIIDSIYLCVQGISKYLNFQSAGKKSTFQERSKSEKTVYCRILIM